MKKLKITSIQNGTVIDHLPSKFIFKIAQILNLPDSNNTIIVAGNLTSQKMKRKGMIKIEGKFLTKKELEKISLLSNMATVNIIKNDKSWKKFTLSLPLNLNNLAICSNANCITNQKKEIVDSKMSLGKRKNGKKYYRCFYCEKVIEIDDLKIK